MFILVQMDAIVNYDRKKIISEGVAVLCGVGVRELRVGLRVARWTEF